MRIHQNSLDAYRAEEVKLSRRAEAVLAWITEHGPHTDREVMQGMGFSEPNAVRPRITELIEAAKLMEVGNVRCPVTGKTVRRVDIRKPRQAFLFAPSAESDGTSLPSSSQASRSLVRQPSPIVASESAYAKGTT